MSGSKGGTESSKSEKCVSGDLMIGYVDSPLECLSAKGTERANSINEWRGMIDRIRVCIHEDVGDISSSRCR